MSEGAWQTESIAVACLVGALAGISVFLISAMSGGDIRRVGELCWTRVIRASSRAEDLLLNLRRRLRGACGVRGNEGRGVSLGVVSEMVDIVRLGLLAGLSFDAALGLYCEGSQGVLSRRLEQALLSWQTGLESRAEGLLNAAHDVGVRELESFAVAVSQAIELGAPLAETLEGQGREMRRAHRAMVERQIERAPVKLLIPVGTLILPALLLSILGPLLAAGGMV